MLTEVSPRFSVQLNDGFISCGRRSVSESSSDCYIMEVEKVDGVFRAVSIFSDPKGDNFAMLQVSLTILLCRAYFFEKRLDVVNILQHRSADSLIPIPVTTTCSIKTDLTQFYLETEVNDSFHDIIFQVSFSFLDY